MGTTKNIFESTIRFLACTGLTVFLFMKGCFVTQSVQILPEVEGKKLGDTKKLQMLNPKQNSKFRTNSVGHEEMDRPCFRMGSFFSVEKGPDWLSCGYRFL